MPKERVSLVARNYEGELSEKEDFFEKVLLFVQSVWIFFPQIFLMMLVKKIL